MRRRLVLTKSRVRDVLACETGALVANEVVAEMDRPSMLGQLVDRIVSTYVVMGRVPDDPVRVRHRVAQS